MKKNILVTGSHRSGTTWIANVISKAKKTRYIAEPFNIKKRKNSPFNFWFEYLIDSPVEHQENVSNYIESFYKILHFNNFKRLTKKRSLKGIYYYLLDLKRRSTARTVIKDPIAIMSAEWMYENFDLDIIVLIRHPAAFVSSLKVKD
jgi:hypothetical protein